MDPRELENDDQAIDMPTEQTEDMDRSDTTSVDDGTDTFGEQIPTDTDELLDDTPRADTLTADEIDERVREE